MNKRCWSFLFIIFYIYLLNDFGLFLLIRLITNIFPKFLFVLNIFSFILIREGQVMPVMTGMIARRTEVGVGDGGPREGATTTTFEAEDDAVSATTGETVEGGTSVSARNTQDPGADVRMMGPEVVLNIEEQIVMAVISMILRKMSWINCSDLQMMNKGKEQIYFLKSWDHFKISKTF